LYYENINALNRNLSESFIEKEIDY